MSRPATISPSQLSRILTKKPLGKSKMADAYADEIIMRMLGVDFSDEYESYWMQRGTELEPKAIAEYERTRFIEVASKDRYFHPEYYYVSGEPDGLIGQDGGIEIKCPKKKWHLANIRSGEQIDKYYDQMQGYMWITDRQWWDFVSYDPRFPKEYRLYVKRIERNQEHIDLIESRCIEFWNDIVLPKMKEFDLDNPEKLVA